jgi:hypothetical protein
MIILGSVIVLAIFLLVGWAVSVEMFQQRSWRRRVAGGDSAVAAALIEEALYTWRRGRPPRGVPAATWAGVQAAQLVALTRDAEFATISTAAEGEFRTEDGERRQVSTALEEGMALAARLVDMMLYDVPNLRLRMVRVDVYSTFAAEDGTPVQRPILSTTADRSAADGIDWEAQPPEAALARFETTFKRGANGQGQPIQLAAPPGELPRTPPTPVTA